MNPVQTAQLGTDVVFSWDSPVMNGPSLIAYKILFENRTVPLTVTYTEYTLSCDGTNSTVIVQRTCTIPMSEFILNRGFAAGQLITAKIQAENEKGWSDLSEANTIGVVAQTKPIISPTNFASVAHLNSIDLSWDYITADASKGFSQITEYSIYWDEGFGGNFVYLNSTTFNTLSVGNLTNAVTYQFKIKAWNIFGDGPLSTTALSSKTIGAPGKMDEVQMTQSGTDVILTWTAPTTNGGTIDDYMIKLLNRINNQFEEKSFCDGSNINIKTCTIPISRFINELGYSGGQSIKAIAQAHNEVGWGTESNPNSQTVIAQTSPSTSLTWKSPVVTVNSVYLSWNELTISQRGFSPVTQYNIYSNGGTGNVYTLLNFTTQTYLNVQSLPTGSNYSFIVQPINLFGPGLNSSSLNVTIASIPSKMAPVSVTQAVDSTSVVISWIAPNDNGSPITAYKMLLLNDVTGVYSYQPTLCPEANVLSCTIEMSSITSIPVGKTIRAKVQAKNSNGYSVESNPNSIGAFVQAKPSGYVQGLTAQSISQSSIYLSWNPLTLNEDIGFSPIKNYTVKWNQGLTIDSWVDKTTILSPLTEAIIDGLSLNETYSFVLTATNIYGISPDPVGNSTAMNLISVSEHLILAPGKMNPIEVNQSSTNVILFWQNPPVSNGQLPTGFEI